MKASELLNEYKEIEFVCVNNSFPDATKQNQQDSLFNALHDISGILVYTQDFGEHNSMAAIIFDDDVIPKIQTLAQKHNVKIDLIRNVSNKFINSIYDKKLEGLTHWYES